MGRVHVLDDALINRIAAGEVVERPASIVKELVENSLDARATSIEVRLDGGGKRGIHVADDGEGMDRNDALLALERHATSKLQRLEDLVGIGTLGFRGEALPSIAAVSRFLLSTAATDGAGTEVEVRGGRVERVREVGRPRGTSISVSRLFFNTPARRKFLRAESTELAHVVRLMTRYALAYPEVRFLLEHGERRLIETAAAADLGERLAALLGSDAARRMLPFELERAGVRARGYAGRPAEAAARRDGQHLFVNGRVVQDRTLAHAIHEAYTNAVPRGRHPALVLFVEVEPAAVDVNVHPQKTEVRFRRGWEVHDVVRDALAGALSAAGAVPSLSDLRPAAPSHETAASRVADAAARYLEVRERSPDGGAGPEFGSAGLARGSAEPLAAAPPGSGPVSAPVPAAGSAPALREGTPPLEPGAPDRAVPLAQFRNSYIVAQDGEGLVLIDQHAAHERVLFERYLEDAEQNRVEVQTLMFPLTVELPAHERVVLEEELEEFRRLGFRLEPFGGGTHRLDGVPAVAAEAEPMALLRELLGEAGRARSAASGAQGLRRKLITTAACHAAIKINHPLTREGMQRLLDDLARVRNPTTCPHGRPAQFRLTHEEIERAFRRR